MAMESKDYVDAIIKLQGVRGIERIAEGLGRQAKEDAKFKAAAAEREEAEASRMYEEAALYREQRYQIEEKARSEAEIQQRQEFYKTLIAQTEYVLPRIAALPDDALKYCLITDYLNDVARQFADGVPFLESIDLKKRCFALIGQVSTLRAQVTPLVSDFKDSIFAQFQEAAHELAPTIARTNEIESELSSKGGPLSIPVARSISFFLIFAIFGFIFMLIPDGVMSRSFAFMWCFLSLVIAVIIGQRQIEFLIKQPKLIEEHGRLQQIITKHSVQLIMGTIEARFPEWSDIIIRKFQRSEIIPKLTKTGQGSVNTCRTSDNATFSPLAVTSFALGLFSMILLSARTIKTRFPEWVESLTRKVQRAEIRQNPAKTCAAHGQGSVKTCSTSENATFSSMAVTSFILGLSSFLLLFRTGIPAVVIGHIALSRIKGQRGRGLAIAGLCLGYLTTVLSVIAVIVHVAGLTENR